MKKVLIAVDEIKGSEGVLSVFQNLVRPPQGVVLLHVQRLEGKSMMVDMLGVAEMKTLKESIEGTEYKEELDRKAEQVLTYYKKQLEDGGLISVKTVVRLGIPSEEILNVAEEENVDLVIMGSSDKKGLDRLISGRISKEVEKSSRVPVLLAKPEKGESLLGVKDQPAASSV